MNCTVIILTKNHETIITQTLKSVNLPILVADLGSKDNTVSICEEFGAKVYKINFAHDFSQVRNTLINKCTTDWVFWLDPGEIISSGHEFFNIIEKPDLMYRTMVVKGDLLTKEPRLFRRNKEIKFKRPVFESIDDLAQQTLPIIITGETKPNYKDMIDTLLIWKDKEPLSPEPDYYLACFYLMQKNYDQFISFARQFLFQKKENDASVVMIKYFIALLSKKNNIGNSLKLILDCIVSYPLMAEFWCLLGDLYLFHIKEYDRAYHFYENAVILGSQRLQEDTMPMEISKYEDHPKKMMEVIRNAITLSINSSNEGIKT